MSEASKRDILRFYWSDVTEIDQALAAERTRLLEGASFDGWDVGLFFLPLQKAALARRLGVSLERQCLSSHQVELFRKRFESWFDEFEQQLVAWYRQRTHLVVALISLALAGAAAHDPGEVDQYENGPRDHEQAPPTREGHPRLVDEGDAVPVVAQRIDTILQAAPGRGVVRPLAAGGTAGPADAPKPA